jgi:hypothetical protein
METYRYIRWIDGTPIEMVPVSGEVARAIVATAVFMGGDEDWDLTDKSLLVRDGTTRLEIIRLVPRL